MLCTFIKPLNFKSDSSVTKELDPEHYETKLFHKDIFLHSDTNDPFHSQDGSKIIVQMLVVLRN